MLKCLRTALFESEHI